MPCRGPAAYAAAALPSVSLACARLPLPMSACPCNPAIAYADCCGPLHAGTAPATTAEALMRSRYSAYALGDAAYLRATWHPGTRPAMLQLDDHATTRWLGLALKRHLLTGPDPDGRATAMVEFVARCRSGGASALRLHEISRFVHEDGRWYYLDGAFPGG